MKKALALLLATGSLMCFAAGCGGDGGSDKDSDNIDKGSLSNKSSAAEDETVTNDDIKGKLVSADQSANLLTHAGSSAMLDTDVIGDEDLRGTYWLTGKNIGAKGKTLSYGDEMKLKKLDRFAGNIALYMGELPELEEAGIYFSDGIALGAYVKSSDGYFGTYPSGLISVEDYDYDLTVEDCVEFIETETSEK